MEFSRRDFLRNTAAIAAVAGVLGTGSIAFADNGDENCLPVVNVAAQSRDELAKRFRAGRSGSLEYCAFNPKHYQLGLRGKLPLVVFLHGEDGKGPNGTQLLANDGATFYMSDAQLKKNPTFVIAPQCPGNNWTDPETVAAVKKMIDDYVASHAVDPDRIYIEGMSMGGTGVWHMILTYPYFFAAAIPMCGMVPAQWYATPGAFAAIKHQPIWAYHCKDDPVMPESETAKAVQTMKDNGCGCIKYEGFTAGSMPEPHKVWERVFSIGTPYNWMFTQSLTRTQHGALDPNMMFSQIKLKYGITRIMDFGMDTLYVMDRDSEALVIDTAMGGSGKADLYAYIRNNVLTNPDAALDILLTHNHGDHILGIPSLVASGKVRRTYIHPDDKAGLLSTMEKFGGLTAETMHLQNVNAGDVVRIGQDELEVVHVTGHTPGSVVFFYKDYIFTGDAIGSGDLFLFKMTFDEFYPTIEHFMAEILLRNKDVEYEFLTGHLENLEPFSVDYLRHMMILVRDVIRGDIQPGIYTRKPGRMATYLDANIYYTGKTLSTDPE